MDAIYDSFFVQTNQVKVVQSIFIDTFLFSLRTITLVLCNFLCRTIHHYKRGHQAMALTYTARVNGQGQL